jgi:hypothetical protein
MNVRKQRKSLQPPKGGKTSRYLKVIEPTSLDSEGESDQVHEGVAGCETQLVEDDNVGDLPLYDTQSQNVEVVQAYVERSEAVCVEGAIVKLNVSSHVEEVCYNRSLGSRPRMTTCGVHYICGGGRSCNRVTVQGGRGGHSNRTRCAWIVMT